MYTGLVLEVLVYIAIERRYLKYAQLAPFVDGKVSLVLLLRAAPTFPLAVGFVHRDEVFCEQTTLAPSGGLSDLKSHVS